MSNLEELDKLNDALNENITLLKENAGFLDPKLVNITSLNVVIATYLLSLAVIANKMSEEKVKEEHTPITNEEKFKEVFGFDFIEANDTDSPSWPDLWLESEYKEPIKED